MSQTVIKIENLSQHLFWDVDKSKLDFSKNKKLIIQRVLDYGLLSDWEKISDYYGINEIANTTKKIRDLDIRPASFISLLSKTSIESFLCYTTRQSTTPHWNF